MIVILSIRGRQIYDSRGKPTVEVDVRTKGGLFRASVPSGVAASEIFEAVELRDSLPEFHGKGVASAIRVVNKCIGPQFARREFVETDFQHAIDKMMISIDDKDDKRRCGVNSMAPISMAVCRAGAAEKSAPLYHHIAEMMETKELNLPVPVFNMLNGGIHAPNNLAMQEFLIIPKGAKSFSEAMKMGVEVYHCLKNVIKKRFGLDATNVGDQGAFSLHLNTVEDALDLLVHVIDETGYRGKIKLGIDAAATEFFHNGKYDLRFKDKNSNSSQYSLSSEQLHDLYMDLIQKYPIMMLEDPFDFEDYESFARLTAAVGNRIAILGDDLTVTKVSRIHTAVKKEACNGILIKLNQIGTVTETLNACQLAHGKKWSIMVSHRSGETEDSFIADLAVGVHAEYIKAGAPCRSERMSKYNQLLRIEEELGDVAVYGQTQVVYHSEV